MLPSVFLCACMCVHRSSITFNEFNIAKHKQLLKIDEINHKVCYCLTDRYSRGSNGHVHKNLLPHRRLLDFESLCKFITVPYITYISHL